MFTSTYGYQNIAVKLRLHADILATLKFFWDFFEIWPENAFWTPTDQKWKFLKKNRFISSSTKWKEIKGVQK